MQNSDTSLEQLTKFCAEIYFKHYWIPFLNYIEENQHLVKVIPGLLISPDNLTIYISQTHIAYEISGPSHVNSFRRDSGVSVTFYDISEGDVSLLEFIVGFKYAGKHSLKMPLMPLMEDLIIPSNAGFDKLIELKWNFTAQDAIINVNPLEYYFNPSYFTRLVNAMFFDADKTGLKTRNIRWLDCYPLDYHDLDDEKSQIRLSIGMFEKVLENDKKSLFYPEVKDYQYSKLQQLNRFIELIGNDETTEVNITKFLSEPKSQFILLMSFFAVKLYPEVECNWNSDARKAIRPDFFIELPNGYSNILEFKLPTIKGDAIVGTENRERLSAEIYSYVSQTRVYAEYFHDTNNRNWLKETKGIQVHFPKRIIVVGRRWNFKKEQWKEVLSEFKDTEIVTYDDLIDVVSAHLYLE